MLEAYFSYSRISTDEEHQKFSRQEKALAKYAEDHGIKYFREFKDECTGSTFDRPEFKELDAHLQRGDTVVMKDLSRFTREAENGYQKYIQWLNKGVNIVFIDNPTISSDYIRQMLDTAEKQDLVTKTAMEAIIKLLLIVELDRAEQQRKYISKAIKENLFDIFCLNYAIFNEQIQIWNSVNCNHIIAVKTLDKQVTLNGLICKSAVIVSQSISSSNFELSQVSNQLVNTTINFESWRIHS